MPSGGKRPGSGRKSIYPAGRMADYVVTLPPELHAAAAQLGGGNVSAGVRLALQEAAGRESHVEVWEWTATGTPYAVLLRGVRVVGAHGPLVAGEVAHVMAGGGDLPWSEQLADWVQETDDNNEGAWKRVWNGGAT